MSNKLGWTLSFGVSAILLVDIASIWTHAHDHSTPVQLCNTVPKMFYWPLLLGPLALISWSVLTGEPHA
ncbi:MAG: hypothetical protein CMO80_24435 [Verrucomicrobiales bacterium]|nr:hypothetical protein [Verrucomicrobiales bacterium]|tara:strand:- start:405 stop:611 length:207 start_codon:yes stop_codon:yes gene_type:complete